LTMSDRVLGTPQYMSPEQVSATKNEVTTATDIYSLGAVLYEMITGRPPFQSASIHEMLRFVAEREPTPPRTLNPLLDRDLQTICLKCLEKNPRRRYASANALADDLENWLGLLPISARPSTVAGRLNKWARRRPGVAALVSGLALTGVVAVISTLYALHKARENQKQAEENRQIMEVQLMSSVNGFISKASALRYKDKPGRRWEGLDAIQEALAITQKLPRDFQLRHLPSLQNEAIACLSLPDMRAAQRWPLQEGRQPALGEISPDFSTFAQAGADGRIFVTTLPKNDSKFELPETGLSVSHILRFSRDAQLLAAGYGKPDEENSKVVIWNLKSRRPMLEISDVHLHAFDFTPDGTRFIVGTATELRIMAIPGGEVTRTWKLTAEPHTVRCSPDGQWVAASQQRGGVVVHAINEQRPEHVFTRCDSARAIAWHPRRQALAVPATDGTIYLWNIDQEPATSRSWQAHNAAILSLAWHPNGRHLFSESEDGFVTLWDSRTAKNEISLPARALHLLNVSPDGSRLGPFAEGNQAMLMEVNDGSVVRFGEGHPGSFINSASWTKDGTALATAGEDGVRFWNRDGELIGRIDLKGSRSILWSSDALILSGAGGLLRWPVMKTADATHQRIILGAMEKIDPREGRQWASISRDDRWLAATLPSKVCLFDLKSGTAPREFAAQPHASFVSISPEGNWVATGTWHGQGVRVWSLPDGRVTNLPVSGSANVGFNLDGKLLVTGNGVEYAFWKIGTWERAHTVPTSLGDLYGAMAFSPRGTAIAIESERNRALIIAAPTFREMTSPDFDRQRPLIFSPPHGTLLVNADARQHLVIWDVALLRQQLKALSLDWPIDGLPEEVLPVIDVVETAR
uniref:protein kinase domain-containing protein n=1 Tax=Prosthecobacter sp. TaxID=1965333 RepID=UPI0037830E93